MVAGGGRVGFGGVFAAGYGWWVGRVESWLEAVVLKSERGGGMVPEKID